MTHNTSRTSPAARGSAARRRSATEQHERAIGAINAVFDRVGELSDARERLAGLAAQAAGDDPLRDAAALLQAAEQLGAALAAVRSAASGAAEHRRRGELAADVGTGLVSLFPRTAGPTRARSEPTAGAATTPASPVDAVPAVGADAG